MNSDPAKDKAPIARRSYAKRQKLGFSMRLARSPSPPACLPAAARSSGSRSPCWVLLKEHSPGVARLQKTARPCPSTSKHTHGDRRRVLRDPEKGAPGGLQYLGLQTHLLQLPSLVEALHALLHQEQADAVGRRLGLAVRDGDDHGQIGQPAVGDENLHRDGDRAAKAGAGDAGPPRLPNIYASTLLPFRIQSLPSLLA